MPSRRDKYRAGEFLPYFDPVGPTVNFFISQFGSVLSLFHRPNISVPAGTQLNFQINGLKATYTAEAPPAEPID